jgi:hypothetical protein
VQLDLFILARYAEAQGDMLNMLGAGWDTIQVTQTPDVPEGAEGGPVTVVGGALVARLLYHQITETNRDHTFSVTLVDEDGGQVGRMEGHFNPQRQAGVPLNWPQAMNLVTPLNMPLPLFGVYTFVFEVDGRHLGERAFRVIDARAQDADAEAA